MGNHAASWTDLHKFGYDHTQSCYCKMAKEWQLHQDFKFGTATLKRKVQRVALWKRQRNRLCSPHPPFSGSLLSHYMVLSILERTWSHLWTHGAFSETCMLKHCSIWYHLVPQSAERVCVRVWVSLCHICSYMGICMSSDRCMPWRMCQMSVPTVLIDWSHHQVIVDDMNMRERKCFVAYCHEHK